MKTYKMLSWNVNGIRAVAKKGFLDWFKEENPDILCLQETKAWEEQLDESLTKVIGSEVIDKNNPLFEIPTTHVLVGDKLYSLATSNLDNVDWPNYKILDEEKSKEVIILKYDLDK